MFGFIEGFTECFECVKKETTEDFLKMTYNALALMLFLRRNTCDPRGPHMPLLSRCEVGPEQLLGNMVRTSWRCGGFHEAIEVTKETSTLTHTI